MLCLTHFAIFSNCNKMLFIFNFIHDIVKYHNIIVVYGCVIFLREVKANVCSFVSDSSFEKGHFFVFNIFFIFLEFKDLKKEMIVKWTFLIKYLPIQQSSILYYLAQDHKFWSKQLILCLDFTNLRFSCLIFSNNKNLDCFHCLDGYSFCYFGFFEMIHFHYCYFCGVGSFHYFRILHCHCFYYFNFFHYLRKLHYHCFYYLSFSSYFDIFYCLFERLHYFDFCCLLNYYY